MEWYVFAIVAALAACILIIMLRNDLHKNETSYDVQPRTKDAYLDEKISFLRDALGIYPLKNFELSNEVMQQMASNYYKQDSISLLICLIMDHMQLPFPFIDVILILDDVSHKFSASGHAGQYLKTANKTTIEVKLKKEYSFHEVAAIICHECTHHYLYSKGIKVTPVHENEMLTDAAAIYLGFGEYIQKGYTPRVVNEKIVGNTRTIEKEALGYIDHDQIEYLLEAIENLKKEKIKEESMDIENKSKESKRIEKELKSKQQLEKDRKYLHDKIVIANELIKNNIFIVNQIVYNKAKVISPADFKILQENMQAVDSGSIQETIVQMTNKIVKEEQIDKRKLRKYEEQIMNTCTQLSGWSAILGKYL